MNLNHKSCEISTYQRYYSSKDEKTNSEAIELIKEDKIEVTDLMPAHNFSI